MALPSAVANYAHMSAVDLEVGSPPSPLREHERVPPSEAGSAFHIGSVSEAGGLAAMQGRLDEANAVIARLSLQWGEARAQLAAAAELHEVVVKLAVVDERRAAQSEVTELKDAIYGMKLATLDERHEAQFEINELRGTIYIMKLDWAQWEAGNPPAQPEARMASEVGPGPELLKMAPGLAASAVPPDSQFASAPEGPGAVPVIPSASTHGLAASQAADTMVDAWALGRAAADAIALNETGGNIETRYPVQAREAADPQHAPLKDLHPKDVPPPAP